MPFGRGKDNEPTAGGAKKSVSAAMAQAQGFRYEIKIKYLMAVYHANTVK